MTNDTGSRNCHQESLLESCTVREGWMLVRRTNRSLKHCTMCVVVVSKSQRAGNNDVDDAVARPLADRVGRTGEMQAGLLRRFGTLQHSASAVPIVIVRQRSAEKSSRARADERSFASGYCWWTDVEKTRLHWRCCRNTSRQTSTWWVRTV